MKNNRYYSLILLGVLLLIPLPGWSAKNAVELVKETAVSQEGKGAAKCEGTGRGEGFEVCPPGESCPTTFGPIITDTAVPIDKGKFAIQPTLGYTFVTDIFNRSWRRVSAGGDYQSVKLPVKFTYGLFDNLEVYTVIPFIHNFARNASGPNGQTSSDFSGLGDINLTLKYRVLEETKTLPTVSAVFAVTFPTGHFRSINRYRCGTDILGSGYYGFTGGFNLSKWLEPFVFYANFYYTIGTAFNLDVTDDTGRDFARRNYPRDIVSINLAAEYPITKKWVALFEVYSNWDGGRLIGHKSNIPPSALFSVLPAIEYMATDKLSFALGPGINLFGKSALAGITPYLSMVYAF